MWTLFACGMAASALRGKRADKNSSAASRCFALIAAMLPSPSSLSSGVSGGVAMSGTGARAILLAMSRGALLSGWLV